MVEESNKMILAWGGYSLEEQVIGTWINGKPLYQRSYDLKQSDIHKDTNGEHFDVPIDDVDVCTHIENIALVQGIDNTTEEWWCQSDGDYNYLSFIEKKRMNVIRTATHNRKISQIVRIIIIVQYTKKSDL